MRYLVLVVCLFALSAKAGEEPVMTSGQPEVSARTKRMASQFEKDVRNGKLAQKTDHALDAIIRLAVYKLNRTGHKAEAKKLLDEWEWQWQGEIVRLSDKRALGDHRPLSMWLAEKTAMLRFVLGDAVFKALRLDDLDTINFGIPVVISCVDDVSEQEFFLHFQPLCGTVMYWTSFFTCVGFTWGTGFLFCGPISMGAEYLTESFVAPRLNPVVWNLSCH